MSIENANMFRAWLADRGSLGRYSDSELRAMLYQAGRLDKNKEIVLIAKELDDRGLLDERDRYLLIS